MDSIDRKELDRLYGRLLGKWSQPQRQVDAHNLAELQALMDRVQSQESAERDTDTMHPDACPVAELARVQAGSSGS